MKGIGNGFKALALAGALTLAPAAHAIGVADPAGDFLPTFTGPHNGDLDVRSSFVTFDASNNSFLFYANLNGAIGTTPGASYIWGIDRGAGTERFVSGTPSVGAGIRFDAVVSLNFNNATPGGLVNLLAGAPATPLPSGTVFVTGSTIIAKVDAALLPSTGFTADHYTWNLWPRSAAGNAGIPDFAPDGANLPVAAVPEPETWALLAGGLGLLAWRMRSRKV